MHKKVILLLLNAVLLTVVFSAAAQQPKKIPRIGILSFGSGDPLGLARRGTNRFQQALHELGWVDGKTVVLDFRWADENEGRLFELVAELVRSDVDLVLVTTPRAASAAKKLTKTIPIVVTGIPGPGEYDLVESLDHPGSNITGLSFMRRELYGKRLELLKDVIPTISRVTHLSDVDGRLTLSDGARLKAVARSLGVQLRIVSAKTLGEVENAFSSIRGTAEAVTLGTHAMFVLNRMRIVEIAAKSRIPAIYNRNEFVEAGGLMSYGPDHDDLYRRAAYFVDKILKGAKPADLPVEQPTKFELWINLKTAKALELKIPSEVLMWADRVIK